MARVVLFVCLAALCAGLSGASTKRTNGGSKVSDADSEVTDADIRKLSEQLFSEDKHALNGHVKIDKQGKTYSGATDKKATRPLLTVDADKANAANTNVVLLARLFDKYTPDCTKAEKETTEKKQQQSDLLDGLMATPVLNATLNFLADKGLVNKSKAEQKNSLNKLWFSLYSRCKSGVLGSSGFEHVFLGEIRQRNVSGMHSWLFFNREEQAGHVDYKGYIKTTLALGDSGSVIKVRFTWHDANKPYGGTLFVGTSPELEMSLYTLCFLTRPNQKCHVSAHGVKFHIQTWVTKLGDGFSTIGSAYPEI